MADYRVRKAVAIVGELLEELRFTHRLYRRLARNASVHALNYYATDSSPPATSDTSEGSGYWSTGSGGAGAAGRYSRHYTRARGWRDI